MYVNIDPRNILELSGEIRKISLFSVHINNLETLRVKANLCTDSSTHDGDHPIFAYGDVAIRITAGYLACEFRKIPMEVRMIGKVFSKDEACSLVAHQSFIYCDSGTRRQAEAYYNQLLTGETTFRYENRIITLRDLWEKEAR